MADNTHSSLPGADQATNLPPKEEMITTIQPVLMLIGRDNYEEWTYVARCSRLDLVEYDYRFR